MRTAWNGMAALAMISASSLSQASFITLYDQDFESPDGFVAGQYKDVSQDEVNDLYGGQPPGFAFAQENTVETVFLSGTSAFADSSTLGPGYSDPSGIGGDYALGMLSDVQDDRLGLSFNTENFSFFNFSVDISSLGLDGPAGPFTDNQSAPEFRFTLFDNPGANVTVGSGTTLGTTTLTGTASEIDTLDWTSGAFSFATSGSTNGNVTLQVDLLSGGYAVFDNFKITASEQAGEGITAVPVPATLALLGLGLLGLGLYRRHQ